MPSNQGTFTCDLGLFLYKIWDGRALLIKAIIREQPFLLPYPKLPPITEIFLDHMNTSESRRTHPRSLFSDTSSTPSLQSPTPLTTNDVDHPRYIPVDPFRNPHPHHFVAITIDDIPVFPTTKALSNHRIFHSNPTVPAHGANTPPRSSPLRAEAIGSDPRAIHQPSSNASRPVRLFTHAHDSIPLYHARSASPSPSRNLIEAIKGRVCALGRHLPALFMEALPRKCYLYLLLGLPEVYFTRVSRVFKGSGLSMSEIKKMALELPQWDQDDVVLLSPWTPTHSQSPFIPSSYRDLQRNWNSLVDSLIKEWTILTLISCIILCAILLILQRDVAGFDSITRNFVLFSSIFCILGLLYGGIYILRFGVMRNPHKAAEWAFEAQKIKTHLLWNVWIFLSLPAVFLGWSIILLVCSVMSLVWRTSAYEMIIYSPVHSSTSSGLRAFITVLFGIGMIYLAFVLRMFRRFGDAMDEAWDERVKAWNVEKTHFDQISEIGSLRPQLATPVIPSLPLSPMVQTFEEPAFPITALPVPFEPIANANADQMVDQQEVHSSSSLHNLDFKHAPSSLSAIPPILQSNVSAFPVDITPDRGTPSKFTMRRSNYPYLPACKASKILDMRSPSHSSSPVPESIIESGISTSDWRKFVTDIFKSWELHGGFAERPVDPESSDDEVEADIGGVLERWNASTFSSVGIQALLCQEFPCGISDDHPHIFAVYIIECDRSIPLVERFGTVPDGLCRIDICDPLIRHLRTSLLSSNANARVCSDSSLSLEVIDD